jgi:hypothetical protein
VARGVEHRLVQRFEYQPYGFLHHAIDHVGDAESALSAACFQDPHTPDVSGNVRPFQQGGLQPGQPFAQVLAHQDDGCSVRTRCSPVSLHIDKRLRQSLRHLIHRRGRCLLPSGLRLRRCLRRRPFLGTVRGAASARSRGRVSCSGEQEKLLRHFVDRDRLTSRARLELARYDRLSPALWLVAIL